LLDPREAAFVALCLYDCASSVVDETDGST
jgi:hypothetical protein